MSSILEEAVIHANTLREAAIKNAEQIVIEKYSSDIKDAVEKLLEGTEEIMEAVPFAHEDLLDGEEKKSQIKLPVQDVTGEEEINEEIDIDLEQIKSLLSEEAQEEYIQLEEETIELEEEAGGAEEAQTSPDGDYEEEAEMEEAKGGDLMKALKGTKPVKTGTPETIKTPKRKQADAKKAGKEYDQADIENVKKAGLMTPQEIEKDFPRPGLMQRLKDNIMGTEEQNAAAKARMAKEDEESPDTVQAKVNRMINKKKGGKVSSYKSGGSVSSASKRADGCAQRGKTRGRMV